MPKDQEEKLESRQPKAPLYSTEVTPVQSMEIETVDSAWAVFPVDLTLSTLNTNSATELIRVMHTKINAYFDKPP